MSLQDVEPGRYKAIVKDWGIEEVEKLDGALKAKIALDFEVDGKWESISWDGFFLKRDGEFNNKTKETLVTCGLKGGYEELLTGGSGLDTSKELEITIIEEEHGDKIYKKVEWINEPGGSTFIKKAEGGDIAKKLKGLSLNAGLKKEIKNHAPGAEPPAFDSEEEIGF